MDFYVVLRAAHTYLNIMTQPKNMYSPVELFYLNKIEVPSLPGRLYAAVLGRSPI